MELPLTSEGKVDFDELLNPKQNKIGWETPEEFEQRKHLLVNSFNQAAGNHDVRVQAGTVILEKQNYDPNTKWFTLQIEVADWIKKLNFLPSVASIQIERDDARTFFEEGTQKPLFVMFLSEKDIVWMRSFLLGLGKEVELSAASPFRDVLKDGSLGPEMVWIPEGTFQMGSADSDNEKPEGGMSGSTNSDSEEPVHTVSIKKFAMSV